MNNNLPLEERWNAYTHLFGIIIGIVLFPLLFMKLSQQGNHSLLQASIIYATSFIFLFIASTIYHSHLEGKKKIFWRKLDHIGIYYMISGSYVPYMVQYIPTEKATIFLIIMYSLVGIGTVLKIFFTGKFEKASLLLYIFLGWMIIFMAKTFFYSAPSIVSIMVVAGGIAYMIGVYFYSNDHKKYYHTIWHIFVLAGSLFHFAGVYLTN